MKKIAIVAAYRSAIGSFGGSLKDIKLADLGAQVLTYALEKSTIFPNHKSCVRKKGVPECHGSLILLSFRLPKEYMGFGTNIIFELACQKVSLLPF